MEVQTGGSDTLNSGLFDTASTGKPTDLTTDANTANTSAPIVSSASYNFVAQDVGNWLYVQAGTNWIPGWYNITAVGSNKATLNAAIGAAVLTNYTASTAVGCATVGTPTSGTWAVDYSQQGGVQFSLTGITTAAANAILLSASFTKAMVGNGIQITGGTNFTVGFYQINAVTAGVSATVDRTATTAAGLAGTAGIGGALASVTQAGTIAVGGNSVFIKNGTYTASAAISFTGSASYMAGYNTLRGDAPTGSNRPILKVSAGSINILNVGSATRTFVGYLVLDANGQTSVTGLNCSGTRSVYYAIKALSCATGFNLGSGASGITNCEANTCTTGYSTCLHVQNCTAITCTTGYSSCNDVRFSIASGGTTGFTGGTGVYISNCTAYSMTTGFSFTEVVQISNSIASTCSGTGFSVTSSGANPGTFLLNNAGFGNGTNVSTFGFQQGQNIGFVTLTADPFTNAAGGVFTLNNTSGGGASCRAAAIPGAFPGLAATTGYLSIGAVQQNDSIEVSSHTAIIMNPLSVVGY